MANEINRVNEEFNKFRERKQSIFNKRIEILSKMLSLMFPLLLLVFLQINKYLTPYTYSLCDKSQMHFEHLKEHLQFY